MRKLITASAAALLAFSAASAWAQAPSAPPAAPATGAPATAASPATAAAPTPPSAVPPANSDEGWRTLDPANTLMIETTKGRLFVELRPDLAPLAVARVKTLTRRGYYDNDLFYRVIDKFVSQTGDKGTKTWRSDLPNLKSEFTFTGRPADYASVGDIPAGDVGFVGSVPVQLDLKAGIGWANFCPGVAGMTHGDDPNSANSQIFFLRAAAGLDKTFTAFGRVVIGEDAVRAMAVGEPPPHPDKMLKVRVLADVPAATRPQVQIIDTKGPGFKDLVQKTFAANRNAGMCDIELPTRVK